MDLKNRPSGRPAVSGQAAESLKFSRPLAVPVRLDPAACAALAEAVESAKRMLKREG